MSGDQHRQGLLDTNIVILRAWIDPAELLDEMAITAITLAGLEELMTVVPVRRPVTAP